MTKPTYDLATVQALASMGLVRMAQTSCMERLVVVIDGPGSHMRMRQFACDVLKALGPDDYYRTATDMRHPVDGRPCPYDVYAVALSQAFLDAHGIDDVDGSAPTTWLVKFAVVVFPNGRKIDLLSLHCLEREAHRADGSVLQPTWRDDGDDDDD